MESNTNGNIFLYTRLPFIFLKKLIKKFNQYLNNRYPLHSPQLVRQTHMKCYLCNNCISYYGDALCYECKHIC